MPPADARRGPWRRLGESAPPVPLPKSPQPIWLCLFTSGHKSGTRSPIVAYRRKGFAMLTRREPTAEVAGRPFNNLLRRLNAADYALLEPHLTADEAKPGDVLYNPGDNVQTV